jgi:histidine triad (HIT) family protein
MLAIPKAKSRNIYDITERDLEGLCILVKKIADMQKVAFGASGVKIIHNCESEAGQVVFHTHFHIIPYFAENNTMPDSLNSKEKQAEAVRKLLV